MDTFFLICFIITAIVFYRWTIVIAVLVTAGYVLLWIYCLVVVLVSMNQRAAESAPIASVVAASTPTLVPRAELVAPRAELVVAPNAFDYINKPGEKPRTAFDPTPTPAPLPDYAQKELKYMNTFFWKGN